MRRGIDAASTPCGGPRDCCTRPVPGTRIEVNAAGTDRATERVAIANLDVIADGFGICSRHCDTGRRYRLYMAGDEQLHLWALAQLGLGRQVQRMAWVARARVVPGTLSGVLGLVSRCTIFPAAPASPDVGA
jgi:hypothetical protein